ncbi:MAG: hypothetical protein IK137_01865 [Bacilli bacterium]|nr:hypothetical protein [Bacilli bacterium]
MGNIQYLYDNLDQIVMDMGLDPKFKENPAYNKVLSEIKSLILQMNMYDGLNNTYYRKEEDGTITFSWNNQVTNSKYEFRMATSKNELWCRRVKETYDYSNGQKREEKSAISVGSVMDSYGRIETTSYYGGADNNDCQSYQCNIWNGANKKVYDKYGVQETYESQSFARHKINGNVRELNYGVLVDGARMSFHNGQYYRQRLMIRREKLDVANVVFENKDTGEEFRGKKLIDQRHGLQELTCDTYHLGEHVVIHPLMTAEIEEMLSKEDPKVAEGLRLYARDRERFSYDSEKTEECYYRASVR